MEASTRLFRQNGYAATGTNDIVAASGAPKGSLYHYFPKGKASIAEQAIAHASERVSQTLKDLARRHPPTELIRAYAQLLAGWMSESGFRDGCPITTVLLELAPLDPAVTLAGQKAFQSWTGILAESLMAAGTPKAQARSAALTAIAALEGALVIARVERDGQVIITVAGQMARLFERTMAPQLDLFGAG